MKKLFVLGSNSFSGSNFIDLMLKKDFEIIGCSRSKEYQSVYLPYKKNSLRDETRGLALIIS